MRNVRTTRSYWAAGLFTAYCVVASSLLGQSVRGRVVRSDSTTPAPGVVVTAIAETGTPVASALSSPSGTFILRLPSAGRYELRALRVGFLPTTVAGVDVAIGAPTVKNVILTELPVAISGMQVRERDDCGLAGTEAELFVQLWQQARGALAAARLAEQSGELDVRVATFTGHIDAVDYHDDPPIGPLLRSPHPDSDVTHAYEAVVDRVFAATSADTLLARGYVRQRRDSTFLFDAPSAEALLSEGFGDAHCFGVTGPPRKHPQWIGITFAPRAVRDSFIDIRGVLWLDRSTAELRHLDFDYVNLPRGVLAVCDSFPDRSNPALGLDPICSHAIGGDRLGLGGEADFLRLATGEWLVVRWTMRTLPDAERMRFSGNKTRGFGLTAQKCFDGPDCHAIWLGWPRLVTQHGMVASVRRAGVEIYHDAAVDSLIAGAAAKRAPRHPASLAGTITDLAGRQLANAIVQTHDPGRVSITNRAGSFEIRTLPAGSIVTTVTCRGYQSVRFALPMLPDSTRHVQLRLVPAADRASTDCSVDP